MATGVYPELKCRTSFQEVKAEILQLSLHREFSSEHTLDIFICKTSLLEPSDLSSKLFPLVIAMWENKGGEELKDFYSFDNNGLCLSHGYSRRKNGLILVKEKHDTNISRLVEYGELIKGLIGEYQVPFYLSADTTFNSLRNNTL